MMRCLNDLHTNDCKNLTSCQFLEDAKIIASYAGVNSTINSVVKVNGAKNTAQIEREREWQSIFL